MCDLILYVAVKKSAMSGRVILCWSCTEQNQCVLLEDTMQAWTRNSSVSSQALYHRATAPPCLKKMQCSFINTVMRDKMVYKGLLVISFAACFFVFLGVFLQQIMLTLPRAVAHMSRVIRLPPSMWHFYMNRMQRAWIECNKLDWLLSIKQFFTNVWYQKLVASLTLYA